jgi:hypothetical protein
MLCVGGLLDPAGRAFIDEYSITAVGPKLSGNSSLEITLPLRAITGGVDRLLEASASAPFLRQRAPKVVAEGDHPSECIVKDVRPMAEAVPLPVDI